jgi:DNA-binding IclR family transcriptional regulator
MRPSVPHNGSQVQVLDRAMTLLDAMAADLRPLGLAALAARANLSKTTARRLLLALEQHGLCERTVGGEYRLGLRLFEFGMLVQARLDLRERGREALERLAESTHLTVFLCVREDDRAICIERIDGRYAHTLALRLGGSLPLHAGAAPLVLLAFAADNEVERYLERAAEFERFSARTMTSPEAVREAVRQCRARGWVVSDEDVTTGVAAIGAPVFDHSGAVVAAVSVSGLIPNVLGEDKERLIALVADAGAALSGALGFRKGVATVTPAGMPDLATGAT